MAADIEALNASLVVVSPQLEKYSRQVVKKHGLTFRVLGDRENRLADRFGLAFRLPGDLRGLYEKFGIDLKRFNGDDSGSLPMPGRFIIDPRGRILEAHVHPDYTRRPEPGDIVTFLEGRHQPRS